ncbi:MAG: hypothetical protein ACTJLM_04560 [Ehrlichia sp.]
MIKKTNEYVEKVIRSFSPEDVINPNMPTSMSTTRIELQNPQIKYRAVITSIASNKTSDNKNNITQEEKVSTTHGTTCTLDIIHILNHLNTIDHRGQDKQLPHKFFY